MLDKIIIIKKLEDGSFYSTKEDMAIELKSILAMVEKYAGTNISVMIIDEVTHSDITNIIIPKKEYHH